MKLTKPRYIRVASDIHLDFDVPSLSFFDKFEKLWRPEPLATDKDTALILAGDLWHSQKPFDFSGKSWIAEISKQFKYIIIVLGNHDFWGGDIHNEYLTYRKSIASQDLINVFLLQNSSLFFDGLKIVGATLWTNFLDENYLCMSNAEFSGMKDYQYISDGSKKINPNKILQEHKESKEYIFSNCHQDYAGQKIIVVTHHSPSYKSLPVNLNKEEFKIENSLYYSSLDNNIEKSDIDLWIHGHSHYAVSYFINNTRILANPRGYTNEKTGFNPWMLIETNTLQDC